VSLTSSSDLHFSSFVLVLKARVLDTGQHRQERFRRRIQWSPCDVGSPLYTCKIGLPVVLPAGDGGRCEGLRRFRYLGVVVPAVLQSLWPQMVFRSPLNTCEESTCSAACRRWRPLWRITSVPLPGRRRTCSASVAVAAGGFAGLLVAPLDKTHWLQLAPGTTPRRMTNAKNSCWWSQWRWVHSCKLIIISLVSG